METLNSIWSTDFTINLLAGFTELLLIFIIKLIREILIKKLTLYNRKRYLYDKRYIVLVQCILAISTAMLFLYFNYDSLTKRGVFILMALLCTILCILILKETFKFWNLGLSHIASQIAIDTYSIAFKSTNRSFYLVGTNAYSFSNLLEFEHMLKRVRESSGDVKLLLADPNSVGLVEAASNRGVRENLYGNQARLSLGQIIFLKRKLGINIEVRMYNARTIDELPIFRAMFLDEQYCVASISVYGRADNGKYFPQIFAKNNSIQNKISKTMYNIVYRYFKSLWNNTLQISTVTENELFEYWTKHALIINKENE